MTNCGNVTMTQSWLTQWQPLDSFSAYPLRNLWQYLQVIASLCEVRPRWVSMAVKPWRFSKLQSAPFLLGKIRLPLPEAWSATIVFKITGSSQSRSIKIIFKISHLHPRHPSIITPSQIVSLPRMESLVLSVIFPPHTPLRNDWKCRSMSNGHTSHISKVLISFSSWMWNWDDAISQLMRTAAVRALTSFQMTEWGWSCESRATIR